MFNRVGARNEEATAGAAESLSRSLERANITLPREDAEDQNIDLSRLNQSQIIEDTQPENNAPTQDVHSTNSGKCAYVCKLFGYDLYPIIAKIIY